MTSALSYLSITDEIFFVWKKLHGLQRYRLIPFPLKSPCVTILLIDPAAKINIMTILFLFYRLHILLIFRFSVPII